MTITANPWPSPSEACDAAILATVHASAAQRANAASHRRTLQTQARYLTDFEHFRRLALSDLRLAYYHDRTHGTRVTKNHRRTWLALFRCFAKHQGIKQNLKITALDRQGNYACELTEPAPGADPWIKLVHLAAPFGITERELTILWQSKQKEHAA